MKSGIYRIKNLISERVYIGSAKDIDKRFKEHLSALAHDRHYNKLLQADWNVIGPQQFVFEVVESVERIEDLSTKEQIWIDSSPQLYNIVKSVLNPMWGRHHTADTKEKIRLKALGNKRATGQKQTEDGRRRLSEAAKLRVGSLNPMFGKKRPDVAERNRNKYNAKGA